MMATMALGAMYDYLGGRTSPVILIVGTAVSAGLYAGAGLLLARRAAGRLRRNVFS